MSDWVVRVELDRGEIDKEGRYHSSEMIFFCNICNEYMGTSMGCSGCQFRRIEEHMNTHNK